jgi:hypothetical protein
MYQNQTLEHTGYSAARVLVADVGADRRVVLAQCGACPGLVDSRGNSSRFTVYVSISSSSCRFGVRGRAVLLA